METRDHSDANELTSRTPHGGSALNFTYDKAGNLKSQETSGDTVTYTYDAWNRLVKIEYDTFTRAEYQYNGLNWRIIKRADTSMPPDGELNQQRVMYYNADWQLLEEFINDEWDEQTSADDDHDRRMQYIWGMRYIDDIALRKEWDAWAIVGTGNPLNTWYHLTDTLFSTIAIMDEAANLIERVSYDAYGNAQHHRIGDINGDGSTNFKDRDLIIEWMGGITTGLGDYGVGDLNRDGVVDYTDASICFADYGAALPIGQLSTTDNVIGYAGYVFNAEIHGSGLYTVRHRHYSPELGRWLTRDPIGYVDGMSLYEYVRSMAAVATDPSGLNSGYNPAGDPAWPWETPIEITVSECVAVDPLCVQRYRRGCDSELRDCLKGLIFPGANDSPFNCVDVVGACWDNTSGGVDLGLCLLLSAGYSRYIGAYHDVGNFAGCLTLYQGCSQWFMVEHNCCIKRKKKRIPPSNEPRRPRLPSCFTEDTIVQTAGEAVAISELSIGDAVLSGAAEGYRLSQANDSIYDIVEGVTSGVLAHIILKGETIKCTPDHRFWSPEASAWVRASELKPGMALLASDGNAVNIIDVKLVVGERTKVLNLRIAINKSYFVGKSGVLVSNWK